MAETLLRSLIHARHLLPFRAFDAAFRKAARELALREEDPALAKVTISARSLDRWCSGQVATMPRPDACRVLEHMFGHPVSALLGPSLLPAASAPPPDAALTDNGEVDEIAAIELARKAAASDVSNGTCEQIEIAVDELAIAYPSTTPVDLLPRVRMHLEYTTRLLDGRSTLEQRRRLLVSGG
jgi:hypothetical protein